MALRVNCAFLRMRTSNFFVYACYTQDLKSNRAIDISEKRKQKGA